MPTTSPVPGSRTWHGPSVCAALHSSTSSAIRALIASRRLLNTSEAFPSSGTRPCMSRVMPCAAIASHRPASPYTVVSYTERMFSYMPNSRLLSMLYHSSPTRTRLISSRWRCSSGSPARLVKWVADTNITSSGRTHRRLPFPQRRRTVSRSARNLLTASSPRAWAAMRASRTSPYTTDATSRSLLSFKGIS